jgi:hypothetical protein
MHLTASKELNPDLFLILRFLALALTVYDLAVFAHAEKL